MDPESIQKYAEVAKTLNIPEGEVLNFIRESMKAERDERARQREQEKIDKREDEDRNQRMKLEEMKLKAEEEERKERMKIEEGERKERMRIEDDERKERIRLEELKINAELERERIRVQAEQAVEDGSNNTRSGSESQQPSRKRFVIDIGKWKPDETDLNTFLCRFETCASALEVQGKMKALELTRCLEGTALELVQTLSAEERLDYEAIKKILQHRFRCTEGYYRKLFKTAKTRAAESQKSLIDRIKMYLKNWLEMSGYENDYAGLSELIIRDSYFFAQPIEVRTFLKEAGKLTLDEMMRKAQNYRDAHEMHENEEHIQSKPKHDKVRDANNKMWRGREKQNQNETKTGHFKQNRQNPRNFEERSDHNNTQNPLPTCWICGSKGHKAFTCPQKVSGNNQNKQHGHKIAACQTINGDSYENRVVNVPGVGKIPKIAAMSNSAVREREILDMSRSPVSTGEANGVEVECLRDTGSSVSIVRSNLVKPEQYTGKEVTCILVDQCVKKCPQAEIMVKTEWYVGKLPVVCMDRCIYDLIVGNDVHNMTQKETTVETDDAFDEYYGDMHHNYVIFENSNLSEGQPKGKWPSDEMLDKANFSKKKKPEDKLENCGENCSANRSVVKSPLWEKCDVVLKDQTAEGHEELFNRCVSDVNSHSKQLGFMTGEVKRNHLKDEADRGHANEINRAKCDDSSHEWQMDTMTGEVKRIHQIHTENKVCGCEMFLREAEHKIVSETEDLNRVDKNFLGEPEMDYIRSSNLCYEEQAGAKPAGIFSVEDDSHKSSKIAAVQTRAAKAAEAANSGPRPLKVTKVEDLDVDYEKFKSLQHQDESLAKYWDLAKQQSDRGDSRAQFVIKRGLLYRLYRAGPDSDVIKQVCVPQPLVDKVIRMAHETLLSGHQGIKRTTDKILREFYFPLLATKVKRFVKSCDLCQRCSNKNVGGVAPIQSMPISSEVFETVYIDLVGEIIPNSAEGHKYILTMIDSATRFFIAIPLKKTDSVTIAETLMSQFCIFGIPSMIHMDHGSNLNSELMRQLYDLYGVSIRHSSIYHPQGNSVIERNHATMKNILKKLITEQPRQWHRFIAPLLFAMRSTPNVTGYSSFELMFGRSCRTHMSILRELWTGEKHDVETKTTYQYVLDLRQRIEETCKLAQAELIKVQNRNMNYKNKRSKLRVLSPGDKVLVLLPTESNKLLFQWKGVAEVVERKGLVNYRVKFNSGQVKTFHINMLKKYYERDSEVEEKQDSRPISNGENTQGEAENTDDSVEIVAAVTGVVENSDEELETEESECQVSEYKEIYNKEQKETWRDVDVNPELNAEQKRQVWELIEEYDDIFSDVPTTTTLLKHQIKLTSDEPVYCKPYKLPLQLVELVAKEIQDLERRGWIEPSDAPYASPIVVVKKKITADIRLCVNYKRLNDITINDPMPMPEIDDILAKLGKSNMYSTTDMCKGYYAIQLDEKSQEYSTFCTPAQNYKWKVMPFGLKTAGATYTRLLKMVLNGAQNLENFIDDVIGHSDGFESHLKVLRDLFSRVRAANLKIKPSKTKFCYPEVNFLGHVISQGQIKPMTESVEKILSAPVPKTKKDVRSFLGAVGFLRKFIPGCAGILKPLTDLTSKVNGEVVKWENRQQKAFDTVKQWLTTEPVLEIFQLDKHHILQTDASNYQIGAVLMQKGEDGESHPVMYASRKLLPREVRYAIPEKEALAIFWGVHKFYKYLYGTKFTIQTDCSALTILNGKPAKNARILRWQLFLQNMDYTVEVIPGKTNGIADYLSRMNDYDNNRAE